MRALLTLRVRGVSEKHATLGKSHFDCPYCRFAVTNVQQRIVVGSREIVCLNTCPDDGAHGTLAAFAVCSEENEAECFDARRSHTPTARAC